MSQCRHTFASVHLTVNWYLDVNRLFFIVYCVRSIKNAGLYPSHCGFEDKARHTGESNHVLHFLEYTKAGRLTI